MDKPYGCHLCDIGFSKPNELKSHLDSHENQPAEFRFRCEQCPASFINKQFLIFHQASAHTEQDISSSEQIRSSQEEKAYKCDQCDKSFIRVGNFRTHMKWHENGEDHFKCNLCNRKFLNQENLLIHERVHSGNTPYQCGFCSKSYSTIKSLRIHQNRMHKNIKKHGCDQCFEIFTSMVKLNIHRMKHFDDPTDSDELSGESSELVDSTPEQYVCNICNKMFKNKRWLEDHKKIHEITMFPCSFCDRFFESISDLKQHEIDDHLTHRNLSKLSEGNHSIQTYKCDICNKEFIRKPLLDAHVLQHTRQKPFGCNFCSSSFQFANELQMHLRTHKHPRPFFCKLCHARFGQHNQLKTHIRHMHTGLSRIQLTRSPSTCSTEDTSTEDNESDTVTVSSVVDSETDIYVLATSDEQGISTVSTDDEDTDNEAVKHFNPMSKSRQREADEMEKKIDSSQKGPVSFLLFGKLEDLKQNEFLYGNRTNPKISTQPDISLNRYDKFEEHFELWENGVSSTVRSLQNRMNKINQSLQGSFNSSGLSEYGRLNQAGDQMIDLPKLSNYAGTDNLLSWPSPQHITLFENIDISEFSDDSTDSKPRRRKFSGRSIMSSGSHIGLKAVNPDNSTYMTKEENLSSDLSQLDHAKNSNTPNFHLKSAIDKQDTMLKFHSERQEDVKKGSHFSLFPYMSKHTVATKGRFTKDIIGNDVSSQSRMNNQNLEMYGMKPNDNLKGQFTGKGSSLLHENVTDRKFSQNMSENLSGKYFSGKTEICKQFRPKLQSSACLSPKSNYSSDMSDYHGNIQEDNKHSPFKSFIQSYKKRMFQKSDIKKKIRNGHQNSKRYDSENEISFARPNIVKKESSSKRGFDKTRESDTCDSEVEISFKRPNIKITIGAPKETNENVDSSDNEISFSKKKKQNNDVFFKADKNVESSDNEISFSKKKKHKDGVFIKADQNVSFFLAKPMLGYCSSVDECSSLDNDLADQTTIEDCSSIDSDDRKSMSSHGSYLADDSTVPDDDATPERTPSENSSSSDIESNFDHDYLWDLGYEGENSSMENTLQGASCMYSPASGQSEDGSILDDDNLMTDNCSSIESDIEIDIPHQKLHSKRCMKKKKMWLKRNFKFEISKLNNRPFISNAFYQKDSVDESRALRSAVSKIRKKYGENNSILEDKVANIREIVKRRYFKMKKKSSANSSRESSANKISPVKASPSSNVKLKNHKKTSPTKVSQCLNMNRIRKKKNSQSLEESSRDTDYSFTETLSPKLDIHPMNMMKEPTIRACQPLVEKRANNGDTPSVASGKMPVIKSPIHKTRYAEVKIAKKKLNHNSDVGSSDVGTSENEASHTEEVCILSPPDIFDNYVCKQGLLKQSTRNISEDNRSVKGSSIKSPLYIKSPRYKTRYASQRLAKKRMRNERDNTQYASSHKSQGSIRLTSPIHNTEYASSHKSQGSIRLTSPIHNTQYASSHKSQGSFRLTSPIHSTQYASSHKSQGSFRLTSPVHNTQYASLGPFFNLKSPIYKTRFATRRIAQKRMAIESGKLTNFNTKQPLKGIVYGPTPTSVGTIQTKKRKLSRENEDISNVTKNVKSKSQSTGRRSRPRKRDDAACRRKPPKQNGHVHKVPKPKIISQSNLETCNTLVDATVPKTRSGRPVKSPDRYKKISECTVKLNRVPRQKHTRLQRNDLQKDTPFLDIPEKEKKKSKSRKTRNNSIRKTQKDLSRNNMENFEVIGIEEAETILSYQIRETDKISFLNQKNKTLSPKRKRNKLNKECTNNLSEKKKELDENCSMRNKLKRQESYDTSSIGSIAVYEGVDLDKYIGNESSDSQENFDKNGGCDTYMSDLRLFGRNLDMAGQTKTEERNKFEKYKTSTQQETLTMSLLCREINENTIQMTNGQQNDKICQSEQALPYNIQGYKTAVSEFVVPTVENTRSKCKEREKLMKELQITHDNVREDLKTAVENKKRNIVSNKSGSIKLNKGMNKKDTNMGSTFHPTCSTIYTNKNDKNVDKNEVVKPCIIQKLKDKMGSIVGDLMKNSLKKNQAKKSSILKVPVYKRNNYYKGAYVPLDRLDS
ncbi:Hypothetical predicted protein [Mytilus galloprovincialis]|uniref:C2H2-type domain-containing protein n=1 Tax=Mytilus galloprovincialis TaxID=29158 RepID=A0A8B6BWD4_MYTGA|nr:Hypothetical predicted protein [Mytilus galloprovincialis]